MRPARARDAAAEYKSWRLAENGNGPGRGPTWSANYFTRVWEKETGGPANLFCTRSKAASCGFPLVAFRVHRLWVSRLDAFELPSPRALPNAEALTESIPGDFLDLQTIGK